MGCGSPSRKSARVILASMPRLRSIFIEGGLRLLLHCDHYSTFIYKVRGELMKRRRFLQMGAAAVAGTALQPFSSAFASRPYLRVVSVADESGPTLVLHSATVSVAEDNSLLV